jgi:hypothetical protein
MMDCRRALEILEFSDRESGCASADFCSADDLAAAEGHLESCESCAQTVRNWRQLDRAIGQVMRGVPIPRGAQQRLLAQLAALETKPIGSGCDVAASEPNPSSDQLARPAQPSKPLSRRRFLRGLVPVAACVGVAGIGFFSVVWLFAPRWSVEQVSQELAKLDFDSLQTLGNFAGSDAHLAKEAGWERLLGEQRAKGLPAAPNLIAVYGFDIPKSRRHGPARGLVAVIPRNRVRNLPAADSLATASPTSEYVQEARLGESVCVAWQQGDVVCVCLIQGGPDSLSTLQGILEQPSA